MDNIKLREFFNSCDDFINCKLLVAEYKLQKMLQILSQNEEICSLIGECLEQFNRDREFAKAFIQDSQGDYICDLPNEEYKLISFVFCTLVDIDNKKIDLFDFVKKFYGREENPFKSFINHMVVPFRNLLAEAFGFEKLTTEKKDYNDNIEELNTEYNEVADDEDDEDNKFKQNSALINGDEDEFIRVQKLAVQIISELQYYSSQNNLDAITICKAIIKTTDLRDSDITYSLALALKECKAKQVKFLIKEILKILKI